MHAVLTWDPTRGHQPPANATEREMCTCGHIRGAHRGGQDGQTCNVCIRFGITDPRTCHTFRPLAGESHEEEE